MLKINYNPSLYVFTCNIPSEIEISSDAASVYVTIACGPDTIFETTLYPYNNIAMLYDARSIIEGVLPHHTLDVHHSSRKPSASPSSSFLAMSTSLR